MRRLGSPPLAVALLVGFGAMLACPSAAAADSETIFGLPIEFDLDMGADNGSALIARFIPLHAIPLSRKWKLVNIGMAVVADAPGGVPGQPGNPEPVGDGRAFGLGDVTDAVLFGPNRSRGLIWGIGPLFGIPLATDDRLGSGKWTLGPAVRLAYRKGPWSLAVLLGNKRSFAGDSDRADVRQLLIRGVVRRNLRGEWFFTYAPIITANWDAPSGERWLIPIGGGIGRRFELGSMPVSLSVQGYVNVVKPDGAPDAVVRMTLVAPIPRPWRGR
jgi:hypothetical protein